MKAIALMLMLGLSVFSFNAYAATTDAANISQQPVSASNSVPSVDAPPGPLCTNKSHCDPKYKYCCDVDGLPKCVMKLDECKKTK